MKKFILIFIALIFVIPGVVLAEEGFPAFPMSFYGIATYDAQVLTVGTKIQAYSGNELKGEVVITEDGVYGYNNPMKSRLVVGEYTGELLFKYVPIGSNEPLTGGTDLKYSDGFKAGEAIELKLEFIKAITPPSSGGGGGGSNGGSSGGGGGGSSSSSISGTASPVVSEAVVEEEEEVAVLGVEYTDYSYLKNLYGQSSAVVEEASAQEAGNIISSTDNIQLSEENENLYQIISKLIELSGALKFQLAFFIQNSTPTTAWLGAGERAGVLASYIAAFGKFPQTQAEWKDVVKIANGRWPSEKSENKENEAKDSFVKVYKRPADMNNANDDAAVTIMAYGLRPANRNIESERAAIKSFKAIYGNDPSSAIDWDIVRAIAYSGAVR
jgi:hypothetical protein